MFVCNLDKIIWKTEDQFLSYQAHFERRLRRLEQRFVWLVSRLGNGDNSKEDDNKVTEDEMSLT